MDGPKKIKQPPDQGKSKKALVTNVNKEDTDILLKFMEIEWKDIHHSRLQEWSCLALVGAAHVGLIGLLDFTKESKTAAWSMPFDIRIILTVLIIISVFGAGITLRHDVLKRIKLGWIAKIELKLGLLQSEEHSNYNTYEQDNDYIIARTSLNAKTDRELEWNSWGYPRWFSTGWYMIKIYWVFVIFDGFWIMVL